MNLYALSSLVASIFCLGLAMLALLVSGRRKEIGVFAAVSAFIGCWTTFPFVTTMITHPSSQLLATRVIYMVAAFVPFLFWYLFFLVMGLQERRDKYVLGFVLAGAPPFSLLPWSNHYIHGLFSAGALRAVNPGPLYVLFVVYFGAIGCYGSYRMFLKFRLSQGVQRNKYKYLFLGFGIAYCGGLMHFAAAYFRAEPIPHDLLVIAFVGILAYAIIRHRLMDIELVARDSLIHGVVGLVWATPFVLIIAFTRPSTFVLIGLFLVAILGAYFAFQLGRPWIERVIDRVIFQGRYDYLKDLKALGGSLYHIYSLNQLLETLVQGLAQTMGTKTCTVHMWDVAAEALRLKASVGVDAAVMARPDFPNALAPQNALVRWTEQQKGPFLKEELIRQLSIAQVYAVGRPMELLQAELVLPLFAEGQMRGLLTLGPKRSGAMYNQKDFALLATLAEDAERILGYTLIIYEQALTTAKIAHDARQPFQPIEGWLGLLKENTLGPTTPKQQAALERIEANTDFVHAFFDDLVELNALIVQRIRGEVQFEPVDLGQLLRGITEGLQPKVAPGVTLALDVAERLPHAFGHARGIHRALNNLMVNAVKVTKHGKIQVRVQAKRDWIEVRVGDTGPGIPEDQLARLFEPFGQTREPERNVVEGMGLGLTIVKEMVALHEGHLRVESRVGEGTTFLVGLPTVDSGFAAAHQRPSQARERENKTEGGVI